MAGTTELKRLKQEIKELRAELQKQRKDFAELKQFFTIQRTGRKRRPSLHVQCWGLTVCDPRNPDQTQAVLLGGKEGPLLSLWGTDSKARVVLSAENDVGEVSLYGDDLKQAVSIRVLDDGCGQVGVLDKGSPRAVMKGDAKLNNGVVSVVHSDGKVRAGMVGTEHQGGEFLAITADMQTGVKISANAPNGGYVSVNRRNGRAGVILACTELSGSVIVQDTKGQIIDALPEP